MVLYPSRCFKDKELEANEDVPGRGGKAVAPRKMETALPSAGPSAGRGLCSTLGRQG